MTTRGVRVRLTATAAVVSAVVLLAGAVALVLLFQRSLVGASDDVSRTRAADLATLAERGALPATLTDVGDDAVAQVVDAAGTVVAASAGLEGRPPITGVRPKGDDEEEAEEDAEPVLVERVAVPDDDETEDFRVWVLEGQGPQGPFTVYVGASLEELEEPVDALVLPLAVGLPVVLLLGTGLIWLLVGRTLRPVEVAHARQRAFVADAAHELQSPLASYRSQLEVGPGSGTGWPEVARDLLAEVDRMERLVRDLLFLARQDERSASPQRPVDLDDVVLEEVRRVRAGTAVAFDTAGVSAGPVLGSRDDLARMVGNLLANAARHARSKATVTCTASGDEVLLVVADDGAGVPDSQRDHVFERFWRGDEARAHGSGSTGLGLAIVRAVAVRHGGSVRLAAGGPGARFEVRLPSA